MDLQSDDYVADDDDYDSVTDSDKFKPSGPQGNDRKPLSLRPGWSPITLNDQGFQMDPCVATVVHNAEQFHRMLDHAREVLRISKSMSGPYLKAFSVFLEWTGKHCLCRGPIDSRDAQFLRCLRASLEKYRVEFSKQELRRMRICVSHRKIQLGGGKC